MKRLSVLLAVMFAVLAFAGPVFATPLVFRFAGQQNPEHLSTKFMEQMAAEIKDKTQGRVEVKVYPANQLGDYSLVMEDLIHGTIDMSMMSIASEFDPHLEIVYIYGLIGDYEDAKKVFHPDAWLPKKLNSFLEPLGVHLIGSYFEGTVGVASLKPLKEPLNPKVDKGVLVRIPNMDVDRLATKAMGFRPITIPWSDIYQSLQTGVCDAVIGMTASAAYTTLGDIMKEWYNTMYDVEYLAIMISNESWQKLTPEDQLLFEEIGRKYTLLSIDQCKAENEKYMKKMEERGIKVYRYTREQLKPSMEACISTWDELGKRGMGVELMAEFKKELGK